MKSKNFVIDLKVYPFDVMVSIGESDLKLFKTLANIGIDKKEFELASFANSGKGRYCMFENGQSLIRIPAMPETSEDFGFLAHEIFHCVSCLLSHIGMKLKIQTSDEAYAYLISFLTTEIYSNLKLMK